jgi:methyl-accepting chemotaxis protein/methyl-accepting chemotaxis protein-1 (serine sensor receptor)
MPGPQRLKTLSSKLSFRAAVVIAVIVSVSLLITSVIFEASARRQARQISQVVAVQAAAEVRAEFRETIGVISGEQAAFKAARAAGLRDRAYYREIMRNTLADNPDLLGTWTIWKPDAFDGHDKDFVNDVAHDKTGRFIPIGITTIRAGWPSIRSRITCKAPPRISTISRCAAPARS